MNAVAPVPSPSPSSSPSASTAACVPLCSRAALGFLTLLIRVRKRRREERRGPEAETEAERTGEADSKLPMEIRNVPTESAIPFSFPPARRPSIRKLPGEVATVGRADGRQYDERQVLSSHFLLSVYVLDVISWGVGRTMGYEILLFAGSIGISIIKMSIILTTLEVIVEFLSSSFATRAYAIVQGTEILTTKQLAKFAMATYVTSNFIGLTLYPVLGASIHIAGFKNMTLLIVLTIVWVLQYPSVNQIGDQAVEMALPHWMPTFRNTLLSFPGFPLSRIFYVCSANRAADNSGHSQWLWNLETPVSTSALALMLNLMRFILAIILSVAYLVARNTTWMRWTMILTLCFICVLSGGFVLRARRVLTSGIAEVKLDEEGNVIPSGSDRERKAEEKDNSDVKRISSKPQKGDSEGLSQSRTNWFCQLRPWENSLIWFAVLAFGVPEQAFNALLALLTLRVSTTALAVVIVIAAASVVLYFTFKIKEDAKRQHESESVSGKVEKFQCGVGWKRADNKGSAVEKLPSCRRWMSRCWYLRISEFRKWVIIVWISAILLGGSACVLIWGGSNVVFLSIPLLLPFTLLFQALGAKFDGYMFIHPEETSSDIQYWKNVFSVTLNGPVLVVNWFAISLIHGEEEQLALVIAVTVLVYIGVGIYYGLFDECLPEKRNLSMNISATVDKFAEKNADPKAGNDI